MLNPINHALTPEAADRYKVEPYVIAADVYSTAPHEGRGGWTWYTGSAGWMYRAGIEGLLGLSRAGGKPVAEPLLSEGLAEAFGNRHPGSHPDRDHHPQSGWHGAWNNFIKP